MRRFEMRDATSAKFWEIDVTSDTVTVQFGRIGTKGQQRRTAYADPAAAQQAADKALREKVRKGYQEVGGAQRAGAAIVAPPAKRRPAKPRAAKPAPAQARAWPDPSTPREAVRCFQPADDVLFRRGFPHLHVLSDETVAPAAAIRAATEALDAIDPRLHVVVPRDVARRFINGYQVGGTWGCDPKAFVVFVPERVAARDAALASDRELDADMLEHFLLARCPAAPHTTFEIDGVTVNINEVETYGWRLHEAAHVFEACLGTELVAERLRAHLLRAFHDPESWGFWGQDPMRHNASAHHFAFALASLRWRLEPTAWTELVAPFRGLESERLLVFADLLACLADDARPPKCPYYSLELACFRRDLAALADPSVRGDSVLWRSEMAWLLGGAAFSRLTLGHVRRLPDWRQVRLVDELGRLTMPEVAVVIATLVSSRSGRRAASEWLLAHAAHVTPILERAEHELADADDRGRMTAALEMLRTSAPVDAHTLTEEELDREMRDIFDNLEPQLVACKGNVRKELRVVRIAFDRYCEARAAAADVIPEAYFGHQIECWNTRDDTEAARWSEHLTTVQDESD